MKRKISKPWHKRIKRGTILVLVFLIIIPALAGFMMSMATKLALLNIFFSLTPTSKFLSETNVLILGVDTVLGTHRSDTIMVAHLNPLEKEVKVVSIPRDTLVYIPGIGLDKVNHTFAHGGVDLTKKTISRFLNISIPYYVVVDVSGLAAIIDKLGGIKINVEKRMYYVDYAGNLFVDLYPGLQTLNGKQTLGYIRFRHDGEGDIGRIRRQQKFIRELARQFLSGKNLIRSSRSVFELLSNINTNLNVQEIVGLYLGMRQAFDLKRIVMTSLPGKDFIVDGIYYWKPDPEEVKNIRSNFLSRNVPDVRGSLNREFRIS